MIRLLEVRECGLSLNSMVLGPGVDARCLVCVHVRVRTWALACFVSK